jgi:hypothetical protein
MPNPIRCGGSPVSLHRNKLTPILLAAIAGAMSVLVGHAVPAAHASLSAAQNPGQETEVEGQEGEAGGGQGQGEEEAETGAGEGETEGASEEAGPLWTYQMSRIALVLLLFLILGMAYLYYRLVVLRRRGQT